MLERRMTTTHWNRRTWLAATASMPLLSACAHLMDEGDDAGPSPDRPPPDTWNGSAWTNASHLPTTARPWVHKTFPQRSAVTYQVVDSWMDRPALHALGQGANSLIRTQFSPAIDAPERCRFSWYAQALNPHTEVADPRRNDVCLRWTFTFGGDRSVFTARDRNLSELAQLLTGEPLPHATLMYIWDPKHPVGTVIPHPGSSRIRHLVIQSGAEGLNRWNDHERHVMADFERVFDEPAGPLEGVAAFTNSNNTGHLAQAWYGPISFLA